MMRPPPPWFWHCCGRRAAGPHWEKTFCFAKPPSPSSSSSLLQQLSYSADRRLSQGRRREGLRMVFVVHRSSSPSTFCSPPVHRLSTLAQWVGLTENGSLPGECADLDYTAPAAPACPVVPPHPLSGATDPPPPRAAVILPFFFSLTPSCPFQRPTAEVHYRAGKQRNDRRLQKSNSSNEHLQ